MRPDIRRIILNRMKRDYADDALNEDYGDYGDYARDRRDMTDYGGEDFRRGRRRNRRDRADSHYSEEDDEYEKELRLPRKQRVKWLRNLMNKDGTTGPRFTEDEVYNVANKMRLNYDDYTEADVYLMTNVLYSDLCKAFSSVLPQEKEIYHWVAAAKEWLEDDDSGVEGSEKVVAYYYMVVNA